MTARTCAALTAVAVAALLAGCGDERPTDQEVMDAVAVGPYADATFDEITNMGIATCDHLREEGPGGRVDAIDALTTQGMDDTAAVTATRIIIDRWCPDLGA